MKVKELMDSLKGDCYRFRVHYPEEWEFGLITGATFFGKRGLVLQHGEDDVSCKIWEVGTQSPLKWTFQPSSILLPSGFRSLDGRALTLGNSAISDYRVFVVSRTTIWFRVIYKWRRHHLP